MPWPTLKGLKHGRGFGLLATSVSIFGIGLLLGYLVRRTNSLWPSVVTHMLNNFISATMG